MVGNDSSPHLKMFGEVSEPLSAEMSDILLSRPKFTSFPHSANTIHIYKILSKNTNFPIFVNYQYIILFHTMSTKRIK